MKCHSDRLGEDKSFCSADMIHESINQLVDSQEINLHKMDKQLTFTVVYQADMPNKYQDLICLSNNIQILHHIAAQHQYYTLVTLANHF